MSLWESFVVTATLLTVFALLRWKRSEHGAPNSQRYSHYSQRTEARQTLLEPDQLPTEQTFHMSACRNCDARLPVPLSKTSLERMPWRIVWICQVCGHGNRAAVAPHILKTLVQLDRVGGMRMSAREVTRWREATVEELNEAFAEEL